ncbi:ATP-binding cassette, subfamily B, bacterial [Spiroplasma chinense]|uniref:ATP-binding cassette, subfamily B, bacterial n=1 Tax=Spiroplasma chinense TaxID=216932 RepID=A0A5B9Y2X2_9MOLU|nr:ABC transporter ATP-binding protein/permease [Spiroplasma chinense]QEH61418.1 ATP-binding cassette, subfamily B, bacterial [Spiroplasma chinense]
MQQDLKQRIKFFSKDKFSRLFRMLGMAIKEYPGLFTVFMLIAIIDTAIFSGMSVVVSNLVKNITNSGGTSFFGLEMHWYSWVIFGGAMIIVYGFVEFSLNILSGVWTRKIEIFLRVKCLDALVDVDLSFYSKNQIGNIMTRIIGDSQGVADGLNEFTINAIYILILFVTVNVVTFTLDPKIASYCLAIFGVLFLVSMIIFFAYQKALITSIDFKQKLDTNNTDKIMNIRLIKSSATELQEIENVRLGNQEYGKKINKTILIRITMMLFSNFLGWILPGLTTIFIIVTYHDLPVGEVVAKAVSFISAMTLYSSAIFLMPMILRALSAVMNCNWRISNIYAQKSILEYIDEPKEIKVIEDIELKDAEFIYPEAPEKLIMPKTNIVFEKGKSYAFVGETGSGKSTIAKLLLRFYDTSAGQVLINGIDIKELNMPDYLQNVGYVEQEPQILYGTVMDNIRYGKFDATDEEVFEAAKKAQIHDFILGLAEKYDTILGERGFMLSGGQKQRLVIARMFLKNPQVLILDEATSALDNIVEREVQEQLDKLIVGRTTFVIAHRLSTIKNCDEIIVLGKNAQGIIQRGSFDELKDQPGHFNKLYNAGLMG